MLHVNKTASILKRIIIFYPFKFCINCGLKLEEEELQEITLTSQTERTEVMTPVQPAVIQQELKVYSAIPTQSATQQIKEAKSSKAPTVVLIVASIVIVAGGALASLAIIRRLTDSDIESLTDDQICIANNEIWARHGRKFDNKWLQDYFNKQSWYKGTIEPSEFLSVYSPSQIENDNASFLMSTLNGRGYDVNKAHPN